MTESFTLAAAGRLISVKRSLSVCRKLSDAATMQSRFPKSASTFYIKTPSSTISYRPDESEQIDDHSNQSNPSRLNYVMSRSWTLHDHKIFRSFDHYDGSEMATSMTSSTISENEQTMIECEKYDNYDRPNSVLRTVEENYDTPRNFGIVDSGYESLNVSQDHDDYVCTYSSNYGRINRTNLAHYENTDFLRTLENYENSKKFATTKTPKVYQSKTLDRQSSSSYANNVKRSSSTDFMDVFDHKLDQQFICRSQMNEYVQVQPFLQRIQFKFDTRLMRSRTFDRTSMRSSVRSSTASSELSDYMDAMTLSKQQTYETGTQKTEF